MKSNIIEQLNEALDVLKDYPGIEDILDLESCKVFLSKLNDSVLRDVPKFKEVTSQQVDTLIKKSENSIQEWVDHLNKLVGVNATYETSYFVNAEPVIISVIVAKDLSALDEDRPDGYLYCNFFSGDKVSGDKELIWPGGKTEAKELDTSWDSAYFSIVNHVNKNLIVPNLPSNV